MWRQRRRGGDNWTGGRLRGGKDGEEEAPVLSGAVCFCLYVCSHTVEINLPSGLSLWNKERRKLARSDTLREKWRKTRQAQGGTVEFGRGAGGGQEIHLAPPTATTPNTRAVTRKIGLSIPSSTFLMQIRLPVGHWCGFRSIFDGLCKVDITVDEEIIKSSP